VVARPGGGPICQPPAVSDRHGVEQDPIRVAGNLRGVDQTSMTSSSCIDAFLSFSPSSQRHLKPFGVKSQEIGG
jgi:hypothetical protein